jgi:hypothetical protein
MYWGNSEILIIVDTPAKSMLAKGGPVFFQEHAGQNAKKHAETA